jgi:type II secretory pathway pseudopilin PulG
MSSDAFVSTDEQGFSFIEVMIALMLIMIVAMGVGGLFAATIKSTHSARNQTSTTTLAEQKMEQLRSLTWGFDSSGMNLPVSDTTTDLTVTPPTNGGTGLNPSPTSSLDENTPGFVDYLDGRGQWLGTGATPSAAAKFIRRWSIQPLPTNPNNTLVLQVLVTTVQREALLDNPPLPRRRYGDDALIATVKTRKAN